MGISCLISVGVCKPIVDGKQIVQVRGAATVVTQHKQRRQNLDAFPLFAMARIFQPTQHAVRRGKERDRSRTQKARRLDRKSILSQQSMALRHLSAAQVS